MNNKLINELYKPYRITKKGNVTFLDSTTGTLVVKKENKDLFSLFSYLEHQSFNYIPRLIKKVDNDNIFIKEESLDIPLGQKIIEMAKTVALLHSKTVYFKNTTLDNYKEIKENIESNIEYISSYYNILFLNSIKKEYESPSEYLLLRNYSLILRNINYIKENIDKWFNLVKDQDKIRVCINHNNLELDHFLTNNKNILLSWDKYIIDTPIIDLYNLYKKEYLNIDYEVFLNSYEDIFPLKEDERLLLNILISLPYEVTLDNSEIENISNIKKLIIYLTNAIKINNKKDDN